jgi:cytochrome c oxidase subunit II
MALAVVIILLVIGSLLFHFFSPWWFSPIASNWGTIDTTIDITFWVTGVVFVLLNFFLAYCVIRFRHKPERRAHYEPENKKLEVILIGITTIGVAAMLAPGLFVWAKFVDVPEGAAEVEALGRQWGWSFRYPGNDGQFGDTEIKHMSVTNPFGINPEDPAGQDDVLVTETEMVLAVNEPVKLLLRSTDVLHNFTVPQFRVKMDLVPGMVTYIWLTPTLTGEYEILCEELCGVAHYAMRSRVIVKEAADYRSWITEQSTFASLNSEGTGRPEQGKAMYTMCAGCHGANGEGNLAMNAPAIAGLDSWYIARQIRKFKGGQRGAHQDDTYGKQMAPMAATLTNDAAIRNMAAHISSLPVAPRQNSVLGNVDNGRRLYTTCGSCHGTNAQGTWSVNAPRLAGLDDWYLVRQLQNFRNGIRGTHNSDATGKQMAMLSAMLKDEQSIIDVVAYINSIQ